MTGAPEGPVSLPISASRSEGPQPLGDEHSIATVAILSMTDRHRVMFEVCVDAGCLANRSADH